MNYEEDIAKRDARITELEARYRRDVYGLNNEGDPIGGDPAGGYANDNALLRSELAAIKAQEPVAEVKHGPLDSSGWPEFVRVKTIGDFDLENLPNGMKLYAAPVSEAKAQGEYGDAYQGAREDLAIWKRRALEVEEKVLQQEQIIDHLTSEAQGESRFGEPVVTPDAPCVPDGYVLADKKALGTVLQALVNAPHHIRELQVTLQPVELFSDNPINVLIANYEAPAAPVQQVSVPDGWKLVPVEPTETMLDVACLKHTCVQGDSWYSDSEISERDVIEIYRAMLAAAPAAPAADAGHVFYGMDGNHP